MRALMLAALALGGCGEGSTAAGDARPPDASADGAAEDAGADGAAEDADATRDAGAADAAADAGPADLGADPTACNGAAALCDRRFDEVAYLTTHNAMANAADGLRPPNQAPDMPTQLAEGARALMLDTYAEPDGLFLCHGYCALGRTPLVEGLGQIRTFLEAHPREVVSIIFEAYITPDETAAAFADAGLLPLLHTQPLGEPWPTLGELIAAGHRLVVFTDRPGGPAWHHDVWAYAWETPFHVEQVEDFGCAPNRGNPANSLFILNHFLTRPIALPSLAEAANPTLQAHADACLAATGRLPNFVTVDFARIADTHAVVDALNAR
ncbi:MAG: hypothetical protein H6706_05580 [Myxococcales bacterium]|nr:hypothetical protein [Myxococcales bacterium]